MNNTKTLNYRVASKGVARYFDNIDAAWDYLQTLPNGATITVGRFEKVDGKTVWVLKI